MSGPVRCGLRPMPSDDLQKGEKMKTTGFIRRIDEFGRIVIPPRVRTQMEIEDYTPLEIYIDGKNIVLVPYSPAEKEAKK